MKGHDPPKALFYDFRKPRFFLRPEDLVSHKDKNYDAAHDRDEALHEGCVDSLFQYRRLICIGPLLLSVSTFNRMRSFVAGLTKRIPGGSNGGKNGTSSSAGVSWHIMRMKRTEMRRQSSIYRNSHWYSYTLPKAFALRGQIYGKR